MSTPLMTASGTSGSSDELSRLENKEEIIDALGAFVTKGVTLKAKKGNEEIRVIETRTGLLNSIGLQNNGAKYFLQNELPNYGIPIIVNISANSVEGFGKLAAYLTEHSPSDSISGFEINVSCPNIREGGLAFGTNPKAVQRIVAMVKKNVDKNATIITKLSPNVTDITIPAKAAIQGGTDALSMINTVRGMAIDTETRKAFLGNITGGLSGPAIKPVGVFMVHECFKKIPECRRKRKRIPIIGIGGVSCWQDALEYMIAGATAVGIGTAWFINNNIFPEIVAELETYCKRENIPDIAELIGCLQ